MASATAQLERRHLKIGWWSLFGFLLLGLALELLHGFKLGWYLNAGNETRRLMFTLAHTHGTLIALVHLAFAAALPHASAFTPERRVLASRCLTAAGLLLPLGFLLGGIVIYGGDPGLPAVVLVPAGALLLAAAVLFTALAF
jgi:hypothetical protein